jgi:signal transduction histidine kinase
MGGSGLGLSITAHVATALGGRVGVRSELGVGSCFELVLPRAKEVITSGDPR